MMKALLVTTFCSLLLGAHAQYDYAQALHDSYWFYEAERSGDFDENNNRVSWRGDSAMGDEYNGNDLTGGWYDAGDHIKFGLPMSFATTTLVWSIVDFKAGYEAAGELTNALDGIKWPLDYFVKAHYETNSFVAQCADGYADHAFWGRPEQMTMARPCFALGNGAPGADVIGETAASLAAGSIAFKDVDPTYAATLLQHARELWDVAHNNHGLYNVDGGIPAGDFYGSTGFTDELCHGALWLYRATEEQVYLDHALSYYDAALGWAYSWDSKLPAIQMMMYMATGDATYAGHVEAFLRSWMPGGSVTYTPGGLAWRDMWGCLRYAGNSAFIALMAAKYNIIPSEAGPWARTQIDYMLGTNPDGRSYVVGYGNNPPQRPHHRAASCNPDHSVECDWDQHTSPDPNPSVLFGALVGGPDQNDYYVDDRTDYVSNEVATDYNGGFTGALAGLLDVNP